MPAFGGRCTTDGSSVPLIGNARWLPYRIGQGTVDELVPFTSVEAQLSHFNALGLRHLFVRYPGEDHLVFATQDRFDAIVDGLGRPQVVANPRTIDFTWQPHLDRPDLGIGATTAYWTSGLRARATGAGSLAHLVAISRMLPGRVHGVRRAGPTALTSPVPGIRTNVTWTDGRVLPIRRQLVLRLTNVKALTVDLRRARFRCGVVRVTTDGPVAVRLRGSGTTASSGSPTRGGVRLAC